MTSSSAALFLITTSLLAQAPPPRPISLEITGIVVDSGGSLVEGATVHLYSPHFFDDILADDARDTAAGKLGEFRVEGNAPGHYSLTASKKGYIDGKTEFEISATDKKREVRLVLQPAPRIIGRVEDPESGEPISSLPLAVQQRYNTGPNIKTEKDGSFLYEAWSIESYRLHLIPRLWAGDRVRTTFTDADASAVDTDYEESYWPGGSDLKNVVPIQTTPGTTTDLGTIRPRKTTYYRARIVFPTASVPAGTRYQLHVTRQVPGKKRPDVEMDAEVSAGQNLLLLGLRPGSYLAEIQPEFVPPEEQQWAFVPFTIAGENITVTAYPQKGADVEARVLAADGAGELPSGLEIQIDVALPKPIDADGRVLLKNVPVRPTRIGFQAIPQGWFLSEARYRGIPLQRLMTAFVNLPWDGTGTVEMVLDNRPATVEGIVTNGDKPAQAKVVLTPWPPPKEGYTSTIDFAQVKAAPDGKFSFKSLASGDYRIFALPSDRSDLTPEQVDQLVPLGEKITIPRGGSAQVDLKLISGFSR